jgi:pimeloyl-ACP methyl ester carboxylesterase
VTRPAGPARPGRPASQGRPGRLVRLAAASAALVTLITLVASCTSSTATQPAPQPSRQPVSLTAYYEQHLTWHACDNGFQCTRLLVPFNYSKPNGPRFSLPVIKLPASGPGTRIGALVVNPGGPGGSGVEYAQGARSVLPKAVLARFDIVGFDPRGTAGSQPALTCTTGPELDQYLQTDDMPASSAQLSTIVAASKQYAQRCQRRSGALLPYVGTQNAARDMDVLRAALGESQLTYLGKSYGTFLGAWYAQLFPSRVRALVLDGAVDPATSALTDDVTQASGFEVAFRAFAAWCLTASGCPFSPTPGATSAASVNAAVTGTQALITRTSAHPLANHLGDDQQADGAMLVTGIASALYSRTYWYDLKLALSAAFNGDGTELLELANYLLERNANGTYSNLADADTSISCLDRPYPRTVSAYQAAATTAAKSAPLFGAAIVWGSLTCAYWPVPAYPLPRIRAAGARPILVVGTTRDPATPYRQAQALAADLDSGVLLGWSGDGHTAYGEGSSCVDSIVNSYLIDLLTPRSGTVCP